MKYRINPLLARSLIVFLFVSYSVSAQNADEHQFGIASPEAGCAIPTFEAGKGIPVDGPVGVMASADFNNDGKKDFAVARQTNPASISIYLGDSNGGFTSAVTLPIPIFATEINAADFNSDGKLDLLVTHRWTSSTNGVTLFAGDGSGQFSVVRTILTEGEPGGNVVGDFNQDDRMDFAITDTTRNRIGVYYGDDTGNFSLPVEYLVGSSPQSIRKADLNGDGRADLAVGNTLSGFISVLLGRSGGGFDQAVGVQIEPGLNAVFLVTGDVNNDGKIDVIVNAKGTSFTGSPVPSGASILLGTGTGSFVRQPFIPFEWGTDRLWAADVSGDGKLDLLGSSTSGVVTVKRGNGDGTFGADQIHATAGSIVSMAVDDFNYDDKADLAETVPGYSEVQLFYGSGDGTFGARTIETGGGPNSVTTGDFNGDGKPDAAFSNYDLSNISVMVNDGTGNLSPTYTVPLPQQPFSVFSGDFNSDGKLDLGTINWNPGSAAGGVSIALNNGNGFNSPSLYYNGTDPSIAYRFVRGAVVGDVTGDGILDIVMAVVDSQGEVVLQKGVGDGTFVLGGEIRVGNSINYFPPWSVAVGDVNHDGHNDIVASSISSAAVILGFGGTYSPPVFNPVTNNGPAAELVLADFNHDNILDVAMTSNASSGQQFGFVPKLFIALGNGTGGFLPSTAYVTGPGTASIATGDFNNDSNLDIVVANSYLSAPSNNRVGILYGDGTGAFSQTYRFVAGLNAFDVGLADFDGDGRLDIATPNYFIGNVSILRNVCPPAPPSSLPSLSLGPDTSTLETNKGGTNAAFEVSLSGPSDRQVRVDYRTSPRSAGSSDYRPVSGTLVFQPNEVTKSITIPVIGDLVNEPDEQLNVYLSNPLNASIADGMAVLTITEDLDPPPAVSIADVSVMEGNSGSTVAAFPVTLSAVSGKPVTIQYAVSPGSATPKVDYDTFFGTITIPAGSLSRIIAVTVKGDSFVESDETFSVTLSNPVNATLNRSQAVGTIVNDDVGGTVQFASSNTNVPETIGTVQVIVSRSGGNAGNVAVAYSVGGGTAVPGIDFVAAPSVLLFGPNETSKTISVQIINDTLSEATENLFVAFTGVSGGATIGGTSSVSINIADEDPLPHLTVSNLQVTEGSAGVKTISVPATLDTASGRAVSVDFITVPGTATAPADFIQRSGTLNIPEGATQGNIQLSSVGDISFEPNETFSINLTNPVGVILNANSASITLINDDNTNRPFDFTGDDKADLSYYRPSTGSWSVYVDRNNTITFGVGILGDRLAPADYDGDSKTDVAVFRPSEGKWYIFNSASQVLTVVNWGAAGDLPVPTDRDGDGKTDLVLYRESDNTWYTRFANGTFATTVFGVAGDRPVLGDFDGDGLGDIALYRPSDNNWYIIKSSLGFFIQTWGEPGDIPLTGDFDGDGATDQAVFRPSTGQWFRSRTTAGFDSLNWGQTGDIPVAADYDGDGKTDAAIFRPSSGTWYILGSLNGISIQQFGQDGDIPTPSSFNY